MRNWRCASSLETGTFLYLMTPFAWKSRPLEKCHHHNRLLLLECGGVILFSLLREWIFGLGCLAVDLYTSQSLLEVLSMNWIWSDFPKSPCLKSPCILLSSLEVLFQARSNLWAHHPYVLDIHLTWNFSVVFMCVWVQHHFHKRIS